LSAAPTDKADADDSRVDRVDRRRIEWIADQYSIADGENVGIEVVVDEIHVVVVAQGSARTVNGAGKVLIGGRERRFPHLIENSVTTKRPINQTYIWKLGENIIDRWRVISFVVKEHNYTLSRINKLTECRPIGALGCPGGRNIC